MSTYRISPLSLWTQCCFILQCNFTWVPTQTSPVLSFQRCPSHPPPCLLCFSYSTFLQVPKAYGATRGSEILIKIWLSPMEYDSSGGGCYREACGLGGSAEVLSQTGSLMWCDLAHLRGWCEVTRLDPTGKGRWWVQLQGQSWWGEACSAGTRIHSARPFPEVQTQPTHWWIAHFLHFITDQWLSGVMKLPQVLQYTVKGFPVYWDTVSFQILFFHCLEVSRVSKQ